MDRAIQQLGLPLGTTTGEPPMWFGEKQTTTGSKAPADMVYSANKPFILSEGLPPVPYKLTARILRGEFVDMAELLRDNLEAQRQSHSWLHPHQQPPSLERDPGSPELGSVLWHLYCSGY